MYISFLKHPRFEYRSIFKRGDKALKADELKEERMMLLEAWKVFEVLKSLSEILYTLYREIRILKFIYYQYLSINDFLLNV